MISLGSLLVLFLLMGTILAPSGLADDKGAKKETQKKDKKDDGKKAEGVKRSQTTRVGTLTGTLKDLTESSLTLERAVGQAKQSVKDILIATDVKVRLPAEPEFDSKGKPKPFKPDPSDPDRKLGGVKGTRDDLRDGQQVVLTLGKLPNKKLVATVVVVLPDKK
jgi:hypothetical protein